MAWNTGLQGTALNIAAYPGSPLRVVAGPGTGKTYALMRRVMRLLEQNVQPTSILAVTFTRTAAAVSWGGCIPIPKERWTRIELNSFTPARGVLSFRDPSSTDPRLVSAANKQLP